MASSRGARPNPLLITDGRNSRFEILDEIFGPIVGEMAFALDEVFEPLPNLFIVFRFEHDTRT